MKNIVLEDVQEPGHLSIGVRVSRIGYTAPASSPKLELLQPRQDLGSGVGHSAIASPPDAHLHICVQECAAASHTQLPAQLEQTREHASFLTALRPAKHHTHRRGGATGALHCSQALCTLLIGAFWEMLAQQAPSRGCVYVLGTMKAHQPVVHMQAVQSQLPLHSSTHLWCQ